jgi:hypothetical protein
MAEDLCAVQGIRAVALGGSRARGTHRPDSDVDLGLYYDGELDLRALEEAAARWTGSKTSIRLGDWGAWVDGGAWLDVDGTPVDWILRDLRRVEEQCDRARGGQFSFHPQPGHPLGFLDVSYAGEVATCRPLCDDHDVLAGMQARVTPYPDALRAAMLRELWQVDFLLDGAEKGAKSGDTAYVALSAATAAMLVAHGWHAFSGRWVTNEKGLVPAVARLPVDTHGFSDIVASALGDLGSRPDGLHRAIAAIRSAPRPGGP